MTALTIPHCALVAAERWPDGLAVVDGKTRVSFAALADRMIQAAAAFVAAGLQPGERVGLWAQNSLEWITACLGIQAAGGILVPLNTRFKQREVEFILRRSGARMAVAAEEFLGTRYADLVTGLDLPVLRRIVPLGGASWNDFLGKVHSTDLKEARHRIETLRAEDISDIMFTSGTTGEPKGVMATHGQTVRTAHLWARATTIGPDDRFLVLWPFFHCSGYKAGWVVNLAAGATTLPLPFLDVERLMEIVERERVTFLPGPPTLFQTLLTTPGLDRRRLSSLRVSVTGASSVAPSLIEAMRRDLGIPTVLTGYGLTETSGTVTMTSPGDPPEIVTTSCGRAIEGIELACIDEKGHPLPVDQPGEIVVRGPNVMLGYLDDPQATSEAIGPGGWLRTGDIGTLDEAGYLRITDRKKDVVIVGGFNCYPAEIEKILLTHPAVLQAAVIGVPDDRMGEVCKAYVVLKAGETLETDELIAWCRQIMANFKVPRYIAFVAALPVNATGKVQKFLLEAP